MKIFVKVCKSLSLSLLGAALLMPCDQVKALTPEEVRSAIDTLVPDGRSVEEAIERVSNTLGGFQGEPIEQRLRIAIQMVGLENPDLFSALQTLETRIGGHGGLSTSIDRLQQIAGGNMYGDLVTQFENLFQELNSKLGASHPNLTAAIAAIP